MQTLNFKKANSYDDNPENGDMHNYVRVLENRNLLEES
jgi:hypothetical protein